MRDDGRLGAERVGSVEVAVPVHPWTVVVV
jgi:hypothetical protein